MGDIQELGCIKSESATGSDSIKITIVVVGNDLSEVGFSVKRTTRMRKLKATYSEKVGIPVESLRFLYDGKRVDDDATPQQLEMLNNDVIEVYQEQIGGLY